MNFSNSIELEIRGERALFRDPVRHEPIPVPSFETLKGILCSVYWNPVFTWVPDGLRVMEEIIFLDEGARLTKGKRIENVTLRYLFNVKYQLRAHFVWNEQRPDLAHDRDENKHFRIALRSLSRGGRRNVYLGSADCPGECALCISAAARDFTTAPRRWISARCSTASTMLRECRCTPAA